MILNRAISIDSGTNSSARVTELYFSCNTSSTSCVISSAASLVTLDAAKRRILSRTRSRMGLGSTPFHYKGQRLRPT